MRSASAGSSMVSLLVGLGITALASTLFFRSLAVHATLLRTETALAQEASEILLAQAQIDSLLGWSGAGSGGGEAFLRRTGSEISFPCRPAAASGEVTVTIEIEEGRLSVRKNDGNAWTVLQDRRVLGFMVDDEAFTGLRVEGYPSRRYPGDPPTPFPLQWGEP